MEARNSLSNKQSSEPTRDAQESTLQPETKLSKKRTRNESTSERNNLKVHASSSQDDNTDGQNPSTYKGRGHFRNRYGRR